MQLRRKSISHSINYDNCTTWIFGDFGTLHICIFRTRRHVNAFARLIEIYVLIHSRIGGNGKQRARMVVDDGPCGGENDGRWKANERDGGWTEERVRGRVISFLCLLLIYSDAPRLSASGANKFLEPPRQLDTLHPPLSLSLSPCTFSPHAPRFRCPSCPPFSPPSRSTAATRYSGRIEQSVGAAAPVVAGSEKKRPINVTHDRTRGFCIFDQIVW